VLMDQSMISDFFYPQPGGVESHIYQLSTVSILLTDPPARWPHGVKLPSQCCSNHMSDDDDHVCHLNMNSATTCHLEPPHAIE